MRRTPNSRFVLVLRGDPFLLPRGRGFTGEEALALRFVESLHISSSSSSSFMGFPRRGRQRSGGFQERRPAAFTLVELMVVIALIGILSAMIVPEMRGTYEEALLRSTSRQLVNLCNLAYSRAVSLQLPHRIVLDPISGTFALEKRSGRLTGKNFVPAQDVSGSEGELDNRISLRFQLRTEDRPDNASAETVMPQASEVGDLSGRIVIGFYPDGTADPAQIQLRDRQGFGLLLRISPVTARVRVTELARE